MQHSCCPCHLLQAKGTPEPSSSPTVWQTQHQARSGRLKPVSAEAHSPPSAAASVQQQQQQQQQYMQLRSLQQQEVAQQQLLHQQQQLQLQMQQQQQHTTMAWATSRWGAAMVPVQLVPPPAPEAEQQASPALQPPLPGPCVYAPPPTPPIPLPASRRSPRQVHTAAPSSAPADLAAPTAAIAPPQAASRGRVLQESVPPAAGAGQAPHGGAAGGTAAGSAAGAATELLGQSASQQLHCMVSQPQHAAALGCEVSPEHTAALPGYTVGAVIGEGGFCQVGWVGENCPLGF